MEQLNDIEAAVNAVEQVKDRKERIAVINKYLAGAVDVKSSAAKELLHRRALFVTELEKKKLWPNP